MQNAKNTYWILTMNDPEASGNNDGLRFYVLTDLFSTSTLGYSIITIYTSVILVIGRGIRTVFTGNIELIIISD
jgi:hypothetical protein